MPEEDKDNLEKLRAYMETIYVKTEVESKKEVKQSEKKSIGSVVRQCVRVQQQEGESISEYVKRAEVYSVLVQQGGHMSVMEGVMLQEGLRDKVMKQKLEDECFEDWLVTPTLTPPLFSSCAAAHISITVCCTTADCTTTSL